MVELAERAEIKSYTYEDENDLGYGKGWGPLVPWY